MDKTSIELFGTDANSVVIPSIEKANTELYSESISEVLLAPKVDVISVPKDSKVNQNNFIFDFSNLDSISVMQKEVLKSLVSQDGNIELYLYRKNGLVSFGLGEKYYLERVIPLVKQWIFGDEIKVYKDFIPGKQIFEVTGRDFTKLRLNI